MGIVIDCFQRFKQISANISIFFVICGFIISNIVSMKGYTLLIILQFSILHLFGQVVTIKGDKVEVRDINGKYISSGYYSEMNDAIAGDKIVVIWYKNDKVEVRSQELKYISSSYYSSLKKVATSGTNIILYYINKKVEVRDINLKYISSHY